MVKKLYKQEMIYYVRSLLPVCVILMGIALMGRIIHLFEADNWTYSLVANSSLVVYIISVIATMLFTTIFIVIRYYKNMFTGEGYLTLTLPVSFEQHLSAKLLAAMTVAVSTLLIAVFSVFVFLGSEWIVEIYKAIVYIASGAIKEFGVHLGLYLVEIVVLLIVGTAGEILNYYMCISLGQMFRKRRILAAVGIYYGLYLVTQVIVTGISIVTTIVVENMDLTAFEKWFDMHYRGFIHGCLIGGIVFAIITAVILFFICCTILKKRLNLE